MYIQWLPEARDDLERLYAFIKPHSLQAADRMIYILLKAAETLSDFPEKGRPWELEHNFRELPVRFGARGYIIRYRVFEEQIIIVRVWHTLEDR